jgi:hypothetical protein
MDEKIVVAIDLKENFVWISLFYQDVPKFISKWLMIEYNSEVSLNFMIKDLIVNI